MKTPAQHASNTPTSYIPVRQPTLQRKCACGGTPGPTGECAECRRKRLARERRSGSPERQAPGIVEEVVRTPGQPLDATLRHAMERRLGHDFSHVRVHADAKADASAQAIGALAYTVGGHVVFAQGAFAPHTQAGRTLLAHELVHVAQQGSAPQASGRLEVAPAHDAAEAEAERVSQASARMPSALPDYLQPVASGERPSGATFRDAFNDFRQHHAPGSLRAHGARLGEASASSVAERTPLNQVRRMSRGGSPFCVVTRQASYMTITADDRADAEAKLRRNVIYGGGGAFVCHAGACENENGTFPSDNENCDS
ncbi:MAG: DUF4157 domain-containing protein [Rhodothermales bacterium]